MHRSHVILTLLLIFMSGLTFSQIAELKYKDFDIVCDFNYYPGQFIIKSRQEFKEFAYCKPELDFDKYILLGVQGSSSGHFVPVVDLRILKDTINKKIIIEVKLSGGKICNCRVMKPSYRRVVFIDKLEDDYKFEFKFLKIAD
jgi:hypothetical protein